MREQLLFIAGDVSEILGAKPGRFLTLVDQQVVKPWMPAPGKGRGNERLFSLANVLELDLAITLHRLGLAPRALRDIWRVFDIVAAAAQRPETAEAIGSGVGVALDAVEDAAASMPVLVLNLRDDGRWWWGTFLVRSAADESAAAAKTSGTVRTPAMAAWEHSLFVERLTTERGAIVVPLRPLVERCLAGVRRVLAARK